MNALYRIEWVHGYLCSDGFATDGRGFEEFAEGSGFTQLDRYAIAALSIGQTADISAGLGDLIRVTRTH